MSRTLFAILLLFPSAAASLVVGAGDAFADAAPTVAGRTVDQYAADLSAADRVVALRAAKSLGVFGAAAGEPLRLALDHRDAAVRYIAAESLGRIGGKSLESAIERLCELARDESSLAVQMAASFALCQNGLTDEHLPLLIEALHYPERGMACCAAALIGQIGPQAADAREPLETVYEQNRPGVPGGDYHVGGAAMNALRKIREQPN